MTDCPRYALPMVARTQSPHHRATRAERLHARIDAIDRALAAPQPAGR
jgi:hypothetical protein